MNMLPSTKKVTAQFRLPLRWSRARHARTASKRRQLYAEKPANQWDSRAIPDVASQKGRMSFRGKNCARLKNRLLDKVMSFRIGAKQR